WFRSIARVPVQPRRRRVVAQAFSAPARALDHAARARDNLRRDLFLEGGGGAARGAPLVRLRATPPARDEPRDARARRSGLGPLHAGGADPARPAAARRLRAHHAPRARRPVRVGGALAPPVVARGALASPRRRSRLRPRDVGAARARASRGRLRARTGGLRRAPAQRE